MKSVQADPTPTPAPVYEALAPVGAILPFGGVTLPTGWLACDGSAVSRTDFDRLFMVYGEIYGVGDGSTTFNLPDCRGRALVGTGQGDSLTLRLIGQEVGAETHQISIAEMPSHRHSIVVGNGTSGGLLVMGFTTTGGYKWDTWPLSNVGGNQPHNNMQPSLITEYIINAGTHPLDLAQTGPDPEPTPTPGSSGPGIADTTYIIEQIDGQDVAFSYSATAGDVLIAMLLIALIVIQLGQIALRSRS